MIADRAELERIAGAELVFPGLEDARAGIWSANALLVAIGAPRLREVGLELPPDAQMPADPELRLHKLLREEHGRDAYGRYRSLLRRLVRFEHGLDRLLGRALRDAASRQADRPAGSPSGL